MKRVSIGNIDICNAARYVDNSVTDDEKIFHGAISTSFSTWFYHHSFMFLRLAER